MTEKLKVQKFSSSELGMLRDELLQAGLDSRQAAEFLRLFLAGHGYGVSADQVRDAVGRLENIGCNLDCMQAELEKIAFLM